jgi:Insect cuticle protein.
LVICQARIEGGWNSAPNTQYHIQTDEGDERYFRYQTLTGQYRKEKRLHDGSVVGTYGWVDADGYLLLKDYVADNQGYRIVRSKKLYVGTNAPIDIAAQSSKREPIQLAAPSPSALAYNAYAPVVDNSISYRSDASYRSHDYHSPTKKNPISSSAGPYVISSLPSPDVYSSTPSSYSKISSTSLDSTNENSIVLSTVSPYRGDAYDDNFNSKSYEKPLEFPSSNLAPISQSGYLQFVSQHEVAITPHYRFSVSTTPTPPVNEKPTEAPRPVTFRPYYNPNIDYPKIQYQDREPEYDGVSLIHDGFKYYLPKKYQDEEGSSSSYRAGSFGYVDPFGIRRVIYYNTSPEKGFVHRKNNRYVGFKEAPYDPRF